MKYKPGINTQYISRWCQVTKTHFIYFAEGVPYASFLGRPLAVIPLNQIDSIRRVCVDVPDRTKKYDHLKNFQFEIFLRREGEPRWSSKLMNRDSAEQTYTSPLKTSEIQRSATKRTNLEESSPSHRQAAKDQYKIEVVDTSTPKKRISETNINKSSERRNYLGVPGT